MPLSQHRLPPPLTHTHTSPPPPIPPCAGDVLGGGQLLPHQDLPGHHRPVHLQPQLVSRVLQDVGRAQRLLRHERRGRELGISGFPRDLRPVCHPTPSSLLRTTPPSPLPPNQPCAGAAGAARPTAAPPAPPTPTAAPRASPAGWPPPGIPPAPAALSRTTQSASAAGAPLTPRTTAARLAPPTATGAAPWPMCRRREPSKPPSRDFLLHMDAALQRELARFLTPVSILFSDSSCPQPTHL